MPPRPVIAVAVAGNSPDSSSHSERVSKPWTSLASSSSKSSTTRLSDALPHTIAMLRSGRCVHSLRASSGLLNQSLRPLAVSGRLPRGRMGMMPNPCSQYQTAALPSSERVSLAIMPPVQSLRLLSAPLAQGTGNRLGSRLRSPSCALRYPAPSGRGRFHRSPS